MFNALKLVVSVFRWFLELLIQLPVDTLSYVVVPLFVWFSWEDTDGKMRLPRFVAWWDNPSIDGNMGEPFWHAKYQGKSKYRQMMGWLLRNKAYRFRIKYIDPTLKNPKYTLKGNQYINKSTGNTGWLFATAESEGRIYWNFAAVISIFGKFGIQPYLGYGFKREAPVSDWDTVVVADHSASFARYTTGISQPTNPKSVIDWIILSIVLVVTLAMLSFILIFVGLFLTHVGVLEYGFCSLLNHLSPQVCVWLDPVIELCGKAYHSVLGIFR